MTDSWVRLCFHVEEQEEQEQEQEQEQEEPSPKTSPHCRQELRRGVRNYT